MRRLSTLAVAAAALGAPAGLAAAGASGPATDVAVAGPSTSLPPATTSAETDVLGTASAETSGGLAAVTLVEPATAGAGPLPTFRWEPVTGAAGYVLAVLTQSGEPIWAWQGVETSVMLGAWAVAPADVNVPGPLITEAGVWFVAAFDATAAPIAVSEMRPVAP
jgi:hypothetical protein